MLELTKGHETFSPSDEQVKVAIIHTGSWNKGIIQMKNILLLQ